MDLEKVGTNNVPKFKQATSKVPVLFLEIEMHKLRSNREMQSLKSNKQGVAAAFRIELKTS